jgi:hypothetical protein
LVERPVVDRRAPERVAVEPRRCDEERFFAELFFVAELRRCDEERFFALVDRLRADCLFGCGMWLPPRWTARRGYRTALARPGAYPNGSHWKTAPESGKPVVLRGRMPR